MNEQVLLALAMITFGCGSTLLVKIQFEMKSVGSVSCMDGATGASSYNCAFAKPWFNCLEMKVAMLMVGVLHYISIWCSGGGGGGGGGDADDFQEPLLKGAADCDAASRSPKATRAAPARPSTPKTPSFFFSPTTARFFGGGRKGRKTAKQQQQQQQQQVGGGGGGGGGVVARRTYFLLAIPAMTDLLQTVLGNIGLVYVSSSIYSMTRGSVILFSAALSVRFLGKRLRRVHVVSIVLLVLAIGVVGVAGIKEGSGGSAEDASTSGQRVLGILLILAGQTICAAQMVMEEYFLTELRVPPMLMVGGEGFWGCLYFAVLAPPLGMGSEPSTASGKIWHEDFGDTLLKLRHSSSLLTVVLVYCVFIGTYNWLANIVTLRLNAVVRSILDTLRTLGVWAIDLAIWYGGWRSGGSPGEAWSVWSWLELAGFMLLVYGTLTYKEILQMPCLAASAPKPEEDDDDAASLSARV
jgi:drug/metabolite transporter (DMT)-like permease